MDQVMRYANLTFLQLAPDVQHNVAVEILWFIAIYAIIFFHLFIRDAAPADI